MRNGVTVLFFLLGSSMARNLMAQDSSLHMAIMSGDQIRVQVMLAAGADVNAKMIRGWTPLMVAAKYDNTDCMNLLIQKQANVNLVDDKGNTALMIAVTGRRLAAVRLLLKNNAETSIKNSSGLDALSIARLSGFEEAMKLLAPVRDQNNNTVQTAGPGDGKT